MLTNPKDKSWSSKLYLFLSIYAAPVILLCRCAYCYSHALFTPYHSTVFPSSKTCYACGDMYQAPIPSA